MSGRIEPGEPQFGSDSFLDVIANIVGILIILIVVTSLKAARMPAPNPHAPPAAMSEIAAMTDSTLTVGVPEVEPLEPEVVEIQELTTAQIAAAAPLPAPVEAMAPAPPTEPPAPPQPPAELVAEVERLQVEVEKLDAEHRALADQLASSTNRRLELTGRMEHLRSLRDERRTLIRLRQDELQRQHDELGQARAEIAILNRQVVDAEAVSPNVLQLEHRVTPVSRVVNGGELHFRVHHDRVAHVPVEALVGKVKEQLERRKEWMMKVPTHQGEVGPVEGFSMRYIVQRESATVMDELQMGKGVFRINVTKWLVVPEDNLATESPEEALKTGSRFYKALTRTGEDSTLTFWVYPDSFGAFRKLQKFAHENGFFVAARPLPEGVPIAGSPSGSKSTSQ